MTTVQQNCNHTSSKNQDFLDYALSHQFGDIHFCVDSKTGMKAMIGIHSTHLGPALGGCRFIEYDSTDNAILDVMRLARGMSYKAASVNLPLGGGKAVIIKPKGAFDREAYFHAFGQFVNSLNGRYITALDSGTTLEDMDIIAKHTDYVASKSSQGDPSPYTAEGILKGIQAAVLFKLKKHNLTNIHVAIQGLGHVGYQLATLLHEKGAKLTVADINEEKMALAQQTFQANIASTDDIHQTPCDVFSPCALGAIINDKTIRELRCQIIAGAANNQLAHRYHGEILHQQHILYTPDYVINSGGLMFAGHQYLDGHGNHVMAEINQIYDALMHIFELSEAKNKPTHEVADMLAQTKLGL